MSKDNQSASARADANCGAEAKTQPVADEAIERAVGIVQGAQAFIEAWLRMSADGDVDLEAEPASAAFCDGMRDTLEMAEAALGQASAKLPTGDPIVAAWMITGGCRELLLACAMANEMKPLAGATIYRLLGEAEQLLVQASGARDGEVLQ